MNWAAIIWLGLLVAFLIAEAACPCHLISLWFAVGALVAMVASLLSAPVWLQVVLFLVVSVALLALLWPVIRKFINPKLVKTNVDAVVGTTGRVTAAIDNVAADGQVKLGAMYWTARSTSGEVIPQGALVKVDRIEGVKVFVSPAEETAKI
ncbi:MAG: NfeD family protein [Oscillospiraceae bacterium]|nr:NfeD family protein [Oscillospiraceae bacterium]